jgi:5-methylcytosine-specific restriction protein A
MPPRLRQRPSYSSREASALRSYHWGKGCVVPRSTKEWIGKNDDQDPPPRVKLRVKSRANDCCEVCGNRVRYRAQIDHTIALCNGGENRESNLRFLCGPCHSIKTGSDVAAKAKTARTQASLAGFKNTRKPFYVKRKRSTLPLRVAWIDEQGRDRVTWLKPVQSDDADNGH